jgi:CobQ-like glutamine amidotransferase family enzyme
MEFRIGHLYPASLNLYGDKGNLICLTQRLAWRGMESTIIPLTSEHWEDLQTLDLLFIGGGLPAEQESALTELVSFGKASEVKKAVEAGIPMLALCEGLEIMGTTLKKNDGTILPGIGAVNFKTEIADERFVGNFSFLSADTETEIYAFENHAGRIYLGESVTPLGTVVSGHGNNGEDRTEGVRYKNFFGSYGHGPLLPKNPQLADFILQQMLFRKDPGLSLEPLDDSLENAAHTYMASRIKNL